MRSVGGDLVGSHQGSGVQRGSRVQGSRFPAPHHGGSRSKAGRSSRLLIFSFWIRKIGLVVPLQRPPPAWASCADGDETPGDPEVSFWEFLLRLLPAQVTWLCEMQINSPILGCHEAASLSPHCRFLACLQHNREQCPSLRWGTSGERAF